MSIDTERTITVAKDQYDFYSQPSLAELAAIQGVKSVADIDELKGDFWPEDESIEEILATLKEWR